MRIAVRRSWGLPALPLFLALEALALLGRDQIWAIEWAWTTSWINGILVLLGPAVAAIAAAQAVSLRRVSADLVQRSTAAREVVAHAGLALGVAAWACAAHMLGLSIGWLLAVLRHGGLGSLDLPPTGATLLLIVAQASIGAAIGWALPRVITPVLVALAGYLLPGLQIINPALFLIGGATGPRIGLAYRLDAVAWLGATWLVAAIVAPVAAAWLGRPRRRPALAAVTAIGLVAVAAAGAQAASLQPDVLRYVATSLTCTQGVPPVCVAAEYRSVLPEAAKLVEYTESRLVPVYGPMRDVRAVVVVNGRPPLPSGAVPIAMMAQPPWVDDESVAMALFAARAGCGPESEAHGQEVLALLQYADPIGIPPDPDHPRPLSDVEARARLTLLKQACSGGVAS